MEPDQRNSKRFNYDSTFNVAIDCSEAKDPVKLKKNQDTHTTAKIANRRPINSKWRPPELCENGKRIINDVPHTRNTLNNRWDKDITPTSGLVAPVNTPPPPQQPAW